MEKDLEKAYFGVMRHDFNSDKFVPHNLFGSVRVLWSIAKFRTDKWIVNEYKDKPLEDKIRFCFGDTWGRCEWEFGISSLFNEEVNKTDVYTMYVLPNKKLLYNMVMNFSIASCKRVLKKYKR